LEFPQFVSITFLSIWFPSCKKLILVLQVGLVRKSKRQNILLQEAGQQKAATDHQMKGVRFFFLLKEAGFPVAPASLLGLNAILA